MHLHDVAREADSIEIDVTRIITYRTLGNIYACGLISIKNRLISIKNDPLATSRESIEFLFTFGLSI